jgi:hypothetical protein
MAMLCVCVHHELRGRLPLPPDTHTSGPASAHAFWAAPPRTPPFVAGALVVTVAGQASATYDYRYQLLVSPPVIESVAPLRGPTPGGTPVLFTGSLFSTNAVVHFVERDAAGALTGRRSECEWRDVPGMYCTDTELRWVSARAAAWGTWAVAWGRGRPGACVCLVAGRHVSAREEAVGVQRCGCPARECSGPLSDALTSPAPPPRTAGASRHLRCVTASHTTSPAPSGAC